MKRLVLSLVTVSLFFASPVLAFEVDRGNKFLSQCNEAIKYFDDEKANIDRVGFASCVSYLEGFNHSSNLHRQYLVRQKSHPLYCLPKNGIVDAQSVRIVVKYLKDHPEKIHETKLSLVTKAFMEAFPCP